MRLVCAFCRSVVHDEGDPAPAETGHGVCETCAGHFARRPQGISLSEYLDTFQDAIIVVDGRGRVLGVNQKVAALFGREKVKFRGVEPCEAFVCESSRLPEGCGGTVHCRECTIRRALDRVHRSGAPTHGARAWLPTERGCVEVQISVAVDAALVKVTVETLGPPRAQA